MNTNRAQKTYWEIKTPKEKLIAELIQDTLKSRNLYGWSVIFSRAKNTLGSCRESTKEITISRRVVESDYKLAVETAMHEVAHAVAGQKAQHGPAWQKVAVELGARPVPRMNYTDVSDQGKFTTLNTAYGPVQVVVGKTEFFSKIRNKKLTIIGLGRGQVFAADENGVKYRALSDEVHPLHGNPLKIRRKQVATTTRRGAHHIITLGRSSVDHDGKTFYALRVMQKNVYGVAVDGSFLIAPVHLFV